MKVLVTGGAGYIGSRVTAHLLACGMEVTVFDRLFYGAESLLSFVGNPAFQFIAGDIRDRSALQNAMAGATAVVHLAAIVGEAACALAPEATEAINRTAAISAIEVAESLGVERFLFFSTCSNYGVSDSNVLADENSALKPLSLYARTKVDVELFALSRGAGMTVTVLRLATICGLSARMRFDLLISELARAAASGNMIEVYKPDAWRPFLYIGDAARVVQHVLKCEHSTARQRVFNVVGENYQKRGLVDLVRKHFPEVRILVTDASPDARDYRVSGGRIERELGFKPSHTVEGAFLETARAVADGVFVDPFWPGHSAIPLTKHPLVGA